MDNILEEFEVEAKKVEFRKPSIPVASSLLGEIVEDEGTINAEYLKRQTRERIRFIAATQAPKSWYEKARTSSKQGVPEDSIDAKASCAIWIEMGRSPTHENSCYGKPVVDEDGCFCHRYVIPRMTRRFFVSRSHTLMVPA